MVIPNSITFIGNGAFRYCNQLQSIKLPDSMTTINRMLFFVCDSLSSITIPNSVTSIQGRSFQSCQNLDNITWSSNLINFEDSIFYDCNKLKSLILLSDILPTVNKRIYDYISKPKVYVPCASYDNYISSYYDANGDGLYAIASTVNYVQYNTSHVCKPKKYTNVSRCCKL